MAKSIDVGPASAFPEGSVRGVQAGSRALVVVHRGGQLHALRDQCPHQGAALSSGPVLEQACARLEAGRPVFTGHEAVLQCPWHGWAFRLSDGNALAVPNVRVRRYPARFVAGRLIIDL
jgi:3-phenylpropionate/trans-cinnamate dioxygenase ferredoxin subunit